MPIITRDIVHWEVMTHIKGILTDSKDTIDSGIRLFESAASLRKVWMGKHDNIAGLPAVMIDPITTSPQWTGANQTAETTFETQILVDIRNIAERESHVKYIMHLAETIKQVLNHPNNLAFKTDVARVYDSWAGTVGYSLESGSSIRRATITHTAKAWAVGVHI